MVYFSYYLSPIGTLTLFSDGSSLTKIGLDPSKKEDSHHKDPPLEEDGLLIFNETKKWLDTYFLGEEPNFTPPLKIEGSPFLKKVIRIMMEIPYGKVIAYRDIAARIMEENPTGRVSYQSIGQAVGNNPIPIIIPCHRVVGSNGSLTGYGGGLEKKIALLELEKVDMTRLYDPRERKRR